MICEKQFLERALKTGHITIYDGTAPCPKTASVEYSEQVIRLFIYNAVILHQSFFV